MVMSDITEQLLDTDHSDQWHLLLPTHHSVFGGLDFARIWEEHTGYAARLFVVTSANGRMVYPFFMRPIEGLPFAGRQEAFKRDSVTPEYTGPLRLGPPDIDLAREFRRRFDLACLNEHVIAEFAHLHPWNVDQEALDPANVTCERDIVYVDLDQPIEHIWEKSFTYACRKNVNRAVREQIRVFEANNTEHIREFHRIYTQTMDRNHALQRYYFSLDYFLSLFETMRDHARFVLAEYKDQIVAATLYLHDDTDVYSYLGGADETYQQIRPNNIVVFNTIQWSQQCGKRRLILGGGYQPNDGIFRFKSSFSPLRSIFQTYKRVHLPNEYTALCTAWSEYYHSDGSEYSYFPAYRAQPTSKLC